MLHLKYIKTKSFLIKIKYYKNISHSLLLLSISSSFISSPSSFAIFRNISSIEVCSIPHSLTKPFKSLILSSEKSLFNILINHPSSPILSKPAEKIKFPPLSDNILISLFKKSQLSIVINLNFLVSLSCSNF